MPTRRFDPTRRDFVEQAFALAGTAFAGATLAGTSAPVRAAGPNEKIRVAVIGVNGQGGQHLSEWIANPDVEVVAVCDCDPAAYDKHGKRFEKLDRKPDYEKDVRRLLDRNDIDAVSIATPNHWHALMAVWAPVEKLSREYLQFHCPYNAFFPSGRKR